MPDGHTALTNAERQARYRARRSEPQPPVIIKPPRPQRRSRTKRWNDALAAMFAVQAECAAWFEALPEQIPLTCSLAISSSLPGHGPAQPR